MVLYYKNHPYLWGKELRIGIQWYICHYGVYGVFFFFYIKVGNFDFSHVPSDQPSFIHGVSPKTQPLFFSVWVFLRLLVSVLMIAILDWCFWCIIFWKSRHPLDGGPQPLGPWTSTGLWPVRNWAAQQVVSGGQASKASSVPAATSQRQHHHLS